ncbi:MAG: flippase-like domain-containing protein [Bacteroidia bacterium]|nr:flippase-like domain-containing protein [Bacteroidia bacterium]NNM15133.1 flippase-like domain-containing protein [Bacteroidia bacterium]
MPIIIGLGITAFFIIRDFDEEAYAKISWGTSTFFWVFMALVMMVVRDVAYMYRLRILTEKAISWGRSFVVIMLWEFASAISPSVVGGSAFAFFIVNKEGIKMGKSIAVVMATAFLDELFFILIVPVILLFVGTNSLFIDVDPTGSLSASYGKSLLYFFWFGYLMVCVYILIVSYALFINPRAIKYLMVKLFSLPLLRRWKHYALDTGNDLIIASGELKSKKFVFWWRAFAATCYSWTARYLVVNCLLLAFTALTLSDNLLIFARQFVMWIIMLVSPTPGSAGVAEVVFPAFLGQFTPLGLAASLALLWRLISYYPYLIIGAILIPRWVRRKLLSKK